MNAKTFTLGLLLVLGCVGGGRYGVPPDRVEKLDVRTTYSNLGYFHDVRVRVEYIRGQNPLGRCLKREIVLDAGNYAAPRGVPKYVRAADRCDERWDIRFRSPREESRFRGSRKLRDDLEFIYRAVVADELMGA